MSKKLPSIQFYTGDWLKDPALRCCSLAARGLWIDLLCLLHESPRRGLLQHANGVSWTLEQIARATGCSTDEASHLLGELENSGVFSRTELGCIYSRRIVRDEHKRRLCSDAGKKGGNPTLKGEAKGDDKGHGKRKPTPSSSVSSSVSPSPPTPSLPSGWQVVAVAVQDCGVENLDSLKSAAQSGCAPEAISAIVGYFREHREPNGWGPEALHYRLAQVFPGQDVSRGWPPVSPKARSQIAAAEKSAQSQATGEQKRLAREREQAELAELESRFGPALEALPETARRTLAEECGGEILKAFLRDGAKGKAVRRALLSRLRQRDAA